LEGRPAQIFFFLVTLPTIVPSNGDPFVLGSGFLFRPVSVTFFAVGPGFFGCPQVASMPCSNQDALRFSSVFFTAKFLTFFHLTLGDSGRRHLQTCPPPPPLGFWRQVVVLLQPLLFVCDHTPNFLRYRYTETCSTSSPPS